MLIRDTECSLLKPGVFKQRKTQTQNSFLTNTSQILHFNHLSVLFLRMNWTKHCARAALMKKIPQVRLTRSLCQRREFLIWTFHWSPQQRSCLLLNILNQRLVCINCSQLLFEFAPPNNSQFLHFNHLSVLTTLVGSICSQHSVSQRNVTVTVMREWT